MIIGQMIFFSKEKYREYLVCLMDAIVEEKMIRGCNVAADEMG